MNYVLAKLAVWLRQVLRLVEKFTVPQLPLGPSLASFSPTGGWPGTIVTIDGAGFSDARDDHEVTIGGARALVIFAAPNRLVVLAGEATVTGLIQVKVGMGAAVVSATPFE